MFIKFLIVIFTVFIIYLLFSNDTILEGMKKGKKKLKIGKKGGLKKRAKKKAKQAIAAVEDAVEDGVDEGEDIAEDIAEDAIDDAGNSLPKIPQLPRIVNDLKIQMRDVRTQVASLLAEKPTISVSTMDEEEENNGDLGV
jgi:hypothetical protein